MESRRPKKIRISIHFRYPEREVWGFPMIFLDQQLSKWTFQIQRLGRQLKTGWILGSATLCIRGWAECHWHCGTPFALPGFPTKTWAAQCTLPDFNGHFGGRLFFGRSLAGAIGWGRCPCAGTWFAFVGARTFHARWGTPGFQWSRCVARVSYGRCGAWSCLRSTSTLPQWGWYFRVEYHVRAADHGIKTTIWVAETGSSGCRFGLCHFTLGHFRSWSRFLWNLRGAFDQWRAALGFQCWTSWARFSHASSIWDQDWSNNRWASPSTNVSFSGSRLPESGIGAMVCSKWADLHQQPWCSCSVPFSTSSSRSLEGRDGVGMGCTRRWCGPLPCEGTSWEWFQKCKE